MSTPLTGLARLWVKRELISEEKARLLQRESQEQRISFITCMIRHKILPSSTLAKIIATDLGIPFFDLTDFHVDPKWVDRISVPLLFKHHTLPIMVKNQQLCMGVSDPTTEDGFEEIQSISGMHIQTLIVDDEQLTKILQQLTQNTTLHHLKIEENPHTDDAPIVQFVNQILSEALHKRASDIHFEPYEKTYRIRFRIDGLLYEMGSPPFEFGQRLASRLKVMSKLDISERRLPQDGRFKMASKSIDIRISSCPTLFGEKIVLRLLNSEQTFLRIDDIGFEHDQKKLFLNAIQKQQGMILVTGPTGSGKTTTLYSALHELNTPHKNILTIEDPVEIYLKGINQVHTHSKIGLTFSKALRSFLRQDPDIIMVGEIRDFETGEIAVKAAQTGHLVLSTVHTNSAIETLNRLMNIGLLSCDLATSMTLIIAQRLVRSLCDQCKQPDPLSGIYYQAKADGCEFCMNGYKNRIAVHEMLPITPTIAELLIKKSNPLELFEQAKKEGMITLQEAGMMKVARGITSLDEVYQL